MRIEPDTGRKFPRVPFDQKLSLEFISVSYDDCRIQNLSLTGIFATGPFLKHKGKYCLVNLDQNDRAEDVSLQASAKVVRKTDEGIAFEFISMPFESYMFLQTILLTKGEDYSASRCNLPDENCPFEITDNLPISQEAGFLDFFQ